MSPAAFLRFLGKILANFELCVLRRNTKGMGGREETAVIPTPLSTTNKGDQNEDSLPLQKTPGSPGLSALSQSPFFMGRGGREGRRGPRVAGYRQRRAKGSGQVTQPLLSEVMVSTSRGFPWFLLGLSTQVATVSMEALICIRKIKAQARSHLT